jgi:hypothetical protein
MSLAASWRSACGGCRAGSGNDAWLLLAGPTVCSVVAKKSNTSPPSSPLSSLALALARLALPLAGACW